MKFISPPDEAECDSNQMAKHCKVIFLIKNVHLCQIYLNFFRLRRTKSKKPCWLTLSLRFSPNCKAKAKKKTKGVFGFFAHSCRWL